MVGRFDTQEAAKRMKDYNPNVSEIPYRDELYITAPPDRSNKYTFLVSLERRGEVTPGARAEWFFRVPMLGIGEFLPEKYNLPSDAEVAGRVLLRHSVQEIINKQHVRVPLDDRTLLK